METKATKVTKITGNENIPIRKKIWGQIVTELVSGHGMKVAPACRLFGRCRQAFYQSKADLMSELKRERTILENVVEIRKEDPGIGGYKLWLMLCALFGRGFMPGHDSFYMLLRRHRLMLPPRKVRHTTDSNHRYHKWRNLVKGLVPTEANQLWVADITYIDLADGNVCYLHLITDAYSHKIIGWALADTPRAAITRQALEQAISQVVDMKGSKNLEGLIHHSDRGVQYCCDDYVGMLQAHDIAISMTGDHNPTDNAIAERTNGIIKIERIYGQRHFNDMEHARNVIGRYIHFYNYCRPHMSIGYKVPALAHLERGEQKKMWKLKKYPSESVQNENKDVSLQSRTTGPGENVCRST